jgi:RNA polymerase sigma-70 factor (ECF subfamily)
MRERQSNGADPEGGDSPATVDSLIVENSARLLTRIRRFMGPEARREAESVDVLQETLCRALRSRGDYAKNRKDFLRWSTVVARNHVVNEVRKRRAEPIDSTAHALTRESPSLCSQLARLEARRAVRRALDELEPLRRRVVDLRCVEELSWREIAAALERSEETVRKLYHRALLELGQRLAQHTDAAHVIAE